MTGRFVVLTRGLTDPGAGGYWAGPDRPDDYSDCLASPHLRTGGGTFYAPVAAFRDAGIAWRTWNRWHGLNLGHGWVREICRLADITDWTRIPPIRRRRHRGR
jgi:hypothetical protein